MSLEGQKFYEIGGIYFIIYIDLWLESLFTNKLYIISFEDWYADNFNS